jgi:hypothetical protein
MKQGGIGIGTIVLIVVVALQRLDVDYIRLAVVGDDPDRVGVAADPSDEGVFLQRHGDRHAGSEKDLDLSDIIPRTYRREATSLPLP